MTSIQSSPGGEYVDHVLEQTVVLADGSIVEFREIPREQVPSGDHNMEARCYQTVLRLAAQHASEIDRRYPKVLRRVAGYNLDAFVDSPTVNLAKMMIGSEGTLGVVLEAKLRLVPLPKAKAVMVIEFADLLEALFPAAAVTRFNAAQIHDYLPKSVRPTIILMNPPFSAALHVKGTSPRTDLRHLRSALLRLAPGGRLVAITGVNTSPSHPDVRDALQGLDIRIVFTAGIAGALYRHHGTPGAGRARG